MSPLKQAPADLATADEALRARYLSEVLGVLYPDASYRLARGGEIRYAPTGPAVRRDTGPDRIVAEYIVVPDARRPRLLVPAGDRRVAAAAVARYAEVTSSTTALKRKAAIAALRTGADRMLMRDRINVTVPKQRMSDSIDAYVAKVLGGDLSVSVHIGPAHANRKPVLQLLAPNGDTVAFGKLSIGPLTRDLVLAETDALGQLGRATLPSLSVPRVLHAGQWHGREILIQSALPIWDARTKLSSRRLATAMREVAACAGTHTAVLAADPYWKDSRARLDALAARRDDQPRWDGSDPAAEARSLGNAADRLIAHAGGTKLEFGSWHGDWTPWNMATTTTSLLVWDWERFATGVPVGFDAVHFDFQRLLVRGMEPERAIDITLGRSDRLLAPFGIDPVAANLTALLYLINLASRYLEDRQAEAGARLGVLGRWLLPVLTRKVAEL
jgi:hypothetical protein